jgi:sterol desaturase/sphingolipid hydroxylase (fatty acid hydroxylase superfamily)
MHKFHHRFTQPIPSSGNAVTLDEYNIAYVSPFLVAAFLIKPNDISFRITIGIISFLNALIHCIPLSDLSVGKLFIKPGDHIEHHEKLVVKYAAPLLNIDFIVKAIKERIERYNLYRIKGSHI